MVADLYVDRNSGALDVEIQVLRAIGSGVLRPGEQLPTMRQLAVELRVDLNTVRHAYDELEDTGAIVIVRAKGMYVAEKPPPVDPIRQASKVRALAHQAVALAASAGVDPLKVAREILLLSKREGGKR